MADAESLIVSLEADLSKYAPAMAQSSQVAQQAADNIVSSFAQANSKLDGIFSSMSGGLGKIFLAGGAVAGAGALIGYINSLDEEFAKFDLAAKKASLSLQDFQSLRIAAAQNGIGGDTFESGISSFADKLNDTVRLSTDIEKLFKANGIELQNNEGVVLSTNVALQKAADLIANAATYQDKVNFAATMGFGPEWIPLLEQGSEKIRELEAAAAASGAVIDDSIIKKAAEFDRAWTQAVATWSTYFKGEIVTIADQLEGLIGKAWEKVKSTATTLELQQLKDKLESGAAPNQRDLEELAYSINARASGSADPGIIALRNYVSSQAKTLGLDPAKILATGAQPTVAPTPAPPGLPSGDHTKYPDPDAAAKAQHNAFLTAQADIQKHIDLLNAETETIGESVGVQAREKAEVDLVNAAKKAGITISPQVQAAIDKEADAVGRAAQAYADAKLKQEEFIQLQQFVGQQLGDFFTGIVSGSESAKDALKNLLNAIAQAAAQAALLGTGPLAGLFGTGTTSNGGVGGLIGGLVGLFTGGGGGVGADDFGGANFGNDDFIGGNAGGTDYWRGGQTWVGENGPELLNLPRGSQIIPNHALAGSAGGVTVAPVYNIDARGSDANAAALIRNALEDNNKALKAALPGMIRDARAHSRIH